MISVENCSWLIWQYGLRSHSNCLVSHGEHLEWFRVISRNGEWRPASNISNSKIQAFCLKFGQKISLGTFPNHASFRIIWFICHLLRRVHKNVTYGANASKIVPPALRIPEAEDQVQIADQRCSSECVGSQRQEPFRSDHSQCVAGSHRESIEWNKYPRLWVI